MDYEKAYKKALERARNVHKYSSDIAEIKRMEYIFSELAESEDDKIRNFISNELTCLRATTGKGSNRYEELTNAIAWLEKQGNTIFDECVFRPVAGCDIYTAAVHAVEQRKQGNKIVLAFNGAYIPVEEKTVDDIVNEYYSWIEKQGQKPTDKVESKFNIGKIEDEPQLKEGKFYECIKSYYYLGGGQYWFDEGKVYLCEKDGYLRSDPNNLIYVYDCKNWQSCFRPYTEKNAWSKEDEETLDSILNDLSQDVIPDDEDIQWLKLLKNRVYPKQEWSEEDKERYISCLQRLGTGNPDQPETINSKWFKEHVTFLPKRKPSDEQMHYLANIKLGNSVVK